MATNSGENNLGIVSKCQVTDCSHNHEKRCTAGGIYINTTNGAAVCYDYTTQTLEPITREREEVGDVSQCTVIDCSYNQGQWHRYTLFVKNTSNSNALVRFKFILN